jgi:hypothetical protein
LGGGTCFSGDFRLWVLISFLICITPFENWKTGFLHLKRQRIEKAMARNPRNNK